MPSNIMFAPPWANTEGKSWWTPGQQWTAYSQNSTVADIVPPEMLYMISDHWYQYPPLNPLWFPILGVYMIVVGFIAWVGNCMVIYLSLTCKELQSPTTILLANLAFGDFLMASSNFPTTAANCFDQKWMFGALGCELYGFMGGLTGTLSITNLVLITRDRYNVIVGGVGVKRLTKRGAILQVVASWSYSLFWSGMPFFGWNRYIPEGNMTTCTFDFFTLDLASASYIVLYAIFAYFLPLFLIIFYYWGITTAVREHEKNLATQAAKMQVTSIRTNKQSTKTETKLAKVAVTTVILWWMAWTPYCVLALMGVFQYRKFLTPLNTVWGSVFAKASAAYNPIIYAISHPRYRTALLKKFPSLACPVATDDDGDDRTVKTPAPDAVSTIS